MEYSIGDLSKISRVSGRKLNQFHKSGLVIPTRIDKFDGNFRYYDEKCLPMVEFVTRFQKMGFSDETIKKLLPKDSDGKKFIQQMQSSLTKNDRRWEELGLNREKIETFLQCETAPAASVGDLQIKTIPDVLIAFDRFTGKRKEIKEHQKSLLEVCGDAVNGPVFTLFLDYNQIDEEMNLECCVPVTHEIRGSSIESRTLDGMKAVSIVYEGNLEKIWMGYKKIVDFHIKNGMNIQFPSREVHLNGNEERPASVENYARIEIEFTIGDKNEPDSNWNK